MGIPFNEAIGLLLYLAPGFLAMQLYRVSYPAKRMSQFENVAWSIVHSFIILLGLAGTSWIFDNNDFNPFNLTRDASIQPKTILVLLIGGVVWYLFLVGFYRLRKFIPFLPDPDSQAIWPVVATHAPDDELWALVRTKQGIYYFGWLDKYSFDPAAENHEFVLRPAYLLDAELAVRRDLKQGGVYLNTRDIESFEMIPGNEVIGTN
ncbi:MAG: DUF6338 family protein [Gammaproteobacteria bacterium]|nr:DUF6338 family protein [Gammaproteobacteria bacterium]